VSTDFGFDDLAEKLGNRAKIDVPCPECGPICSTKPNKHKRVLRLWQGDGIITYNCARCGAKGFARERNADWGKGTPQGFKPRHPPVVIPDNDQAQRIERSLAIWRGARDIRGTPAGTYLRRRRLDVTEDDLRHVLRFATNLYHEGGTASAMVALMRDAVTDEPCGLHRTFLDGDGNKLGRKMLGRAKGAAIKIDPHENVIHGLHVGEGIETALSARQLGYRPVWALGSAGAIADFPLLAGIDAITVFAENDDASARASRAARQRYEAYGSEAYEARPPRGDFNDLVKDAA
jgi:hypothetical protein